MIVGAVIFLMLVDALTVEGCGTSSLPSGRVIGGSNAPHGYFPWQVHVRRTNWGTHCGGTILNPHWVVTAAHCMYKNQNVQYPLSDLHFTVGSNRRGPHDKDQRNYRPKRIIINPYFKLYNMIGDIALVELTRPIKFGSYVQPICMPSSPARVGEICVVSGWGRTNRRSNQLAYQLQYAKMPVIDSNRCGNAMFEVSNFPITKYSLCSGYGRRRISSCQGDSGGPFVCNRNGKWELHGVVSWGSSQCSEGWNQFSVHANVYNLKPWIQQYVR